MKKICALCLFVLCAFLAVSCDNAYGVSSGTHQHEWSKLVCGSKQYCLTCGEQSENITTHRINNGVCQICGQTVTNWTTQSYVDEFNSPTNIKYLKATAYGTFNNSATNKSNLRADILIDYCSYSIKLFEYGNNLVKNYYSHDQRYNITILTQDKSKVTFDGHMDKSGDRIYIGKCNAYNQIFEESEEQLLNIFKGGGTIQIYIEEYDNPITNYLFTLDLSNFVSGWEAVQIN